MAKNPPLPATMRPSQDSDVVINAFRTRCAGYLAEAVTTAHGGKNIDLFAPCWKPDVGHACGGIVVVRKGRVPELADLPLELLQVG